MQIERCKQTKYSTLQNSNNCFLSGQSHLNTYDHNSKRCSNQRWKGYNRYETQGCKLMKQLMSSKQVTIKSCPQTNSTKSVTNRFKQNKKRCHWPTRTAGLKKANKTNTLTTNPQISNCTKLCNTQPQCKSCSSSNSRKQRHLTKRVTYQQKKKQCTQPNNCCFSSFFRKKCPSSWQAICQYFDIFFFIVQGNRTILFSSPLQMNTLQCLSIPKTCHRFTKPRLCTIPRLCIRMICRMISSQNLNSNSNCKKPNIYIGNSSLKWLMKAHQRYTLPCLCCRSKDKTKIKIHSSLVEDKSSLFTSRRI